MTDNTTTERFVADTREYSRPLRESAKDADRFSDSNDRAALAARKMGLAASESAAKAARAQKDAAEAAQKLARQEIGVDEAARKAANAQQAAEHASIKQAEASLAAAKAERQQAEEYKKLAHEAEVAAAVQRLATLKNIGAAEQHNKLLKDLRSDYGALGRDATRAFEEMETSGQAAFSGLGSMGPLMTAAIVAGIALLPAAATVAGGAITAGLGGAFAFVGLKATAGSEVAKKAIDDMKTHAEGVLKDVSKPFEQTWAAFANAEKAALSGMEPDLKHLFATLAPEVSAFANEVGRRIPGELHGFFQALQADSGPIISELGTTLPHALGLAADGLKQVMDEVARDPQEFGNMVTALGHVAQGLGTVTAALIWAGKGLTEANAATGEWGARLQNLASKMGPFGGFLNTIGGLMERFDLTSHRASEDLAQFGFSAATAAAQAANATQETKRLTDSFDELSKAVNAYLSPQIAIFNDTTQLKRQFIELGSAMKGAKGNLDGNTEASRKARDAFEQTLQTTADLAEQTKKYTGSTQKAGDAIRPMIDRLWTMAGTSKTAQQQVETLANLFGVPLPKNAQKATDKVGGLHTALGKIKSPPPVDIQVSTAQALAAVQGVQNAINHLFGHADGGLVLGFSHGGPAYGLADGGVPRNHPVGEIHGPGSSTSDSIPAWLSSGEFVVNAAAYKANQGLVNAINAAHGRPVTVHAPSDSVIGPGHFSTLPLKYVPPPMPLAKRHYNETLSGSSGGASRPLSVNHNFYIAGSVWTTNELLNELQRLAFERGIDFSRPAGR